MQHQRANNDLQRVVCIQPCNETLKSNKDKSLNQYQLLGHRELAEEELQGSCQENCTTR